MQSGTVIADLEKSIKSTIDQLSSYFTTAATTTTASPPQDASKDVVDNNGKKKKHRKIEGYEYTPSLKLPNKITKVASCADCEDENPSLFGSLYSFFSGQKSQAKTALVAPAEDEYIDIDAKMEALESQIKLLDKEQDSDKIDKLHLEKIALVEAEIVEHAARRVDLFFYTLIAVYGEHTLINKDHTVKQHGKGSKTKGTQGCHCALFNNFKFDPVNAYQDPLNMERKQFSDTLNMTVELPSKVNAFDMALEGNHGSKAHIQICLSILEKTANNELTPKKAMNLFFKVMKKFFSEYLDDGNKNGWGETPNTMRKIYALEKQGTFSGATLNMETMRDNYFYLMLRLSSWDKLKIQTINTWPIPDEIKQERINSIIDARYKEIKNELLNTKAMVPHANYVPIAR